MAEDSRRYISVHTGERIDSSVGRAPQVVDINQAKSESNIGSFSPGTILIDRSSYKIYITVADTQDPTKSTDVNLLMAGVADIDGSIGNVVAYSPTDPSESVVPQKAIKYMQVAPQLNGDTAGDGDTVTFQVPTVSLTEEESGTGDYVLNIDFFPLNN